MKELLTSIIEFLSLIQLYPLWVKIIFIILIATFLTLAILYYPNKDKPVNGNFKIQGQLRDKVTCQEKPNIKVSLQINNDLPITSYSDTNGIFSFEIKSVINSSPKIIINEPNYEFFQNVFNIAGNDTFLDIRLEPKKKDFFKNDLHVFKKHYIHKYNLNGDYEGTISYSLSNETGNAISSLPTGVCAWFGTNVPITKKACSLKDKNKLTHSMKESTFSVVNAKMNWGGIQKDVTKVLFEPVVQPGIGNGDTLNYDVVIGSSRTETSAFIDGTEATMKTEFSGCDLSCTVLPPTGYRIILLHYIVIDANGRSIDCDIKPTENENNGFDWNVPSALIRAVYTLSIKIIRC